MTKQRYETPTISPPAMEELTTSGESINKVADEYVVDEVVNHYETDGMVLYRVRWFQYLPEDETDKSTDNIPQHFIARYWAR